MSRRNGILGVILFLALVLAVGIGVRSSGEETVARPILPSVHEPTRAAIAPSPHAPVASKPATVAPVPAVPGQVRCEVGRALEGRVCTLIRSTSSEEGYKQILESPLLYDGSAVTFAGPASGNGGLRCPGLGELIDLDWKQDPDGATACTVSGALPPPADAPLSGKVAGAADLPEGTVFLDGCGAMSDDPVDADGSFFVQTSAGHCAMRAWRQAGALRIPGPWTQVDALSGTDVDVALSVPTFAPAGMGIGFRTLNGGIGVTGVRAGTPAAAAGIEAGDVILRIDDQPTDGMDIEGFLQAGIGPEGSAVHLEGTTAEGEPFDVTITRRPIDPG